MTKWTFILISEITKEEYCYYFSLMDKDKQNKVLTYRRNEDQKRTIAGEMLARKMLSAYHNIPEELILFGTGEYGKPYAIGCTEFNISHSDDMVVCCISNNPIGIDVERIRPFNASIMRKLCTSADTKYILGNSDSVSAFPLNIEHIYRFYELWTTKEAYFKCVGTGIQNLKSVSMEQLVGKRTTYDIGEYIITIYEK